MVEYVLDLTCVAVKRKAHVVVPFLTRTFRRTVTDGLSSLLLVQHFFKWAELWEDKFFADTWQSQRSHLAPGRGITGGMLSGCDRPNHLSVNWAKRNQADKSLFYLNMQNACWLESYGPEQIYQLMCFLKHFFPFFIQSWSPVKNVTRVVQLITQNGSCCCRYIETSS